MGNRCVKSGSMVYTEYGYIDMPITKRHKKILRKTWPLLKANWLCICAIAFKRWFTIFKELRYIFTSLPSNCSLEDTLASPELQRHIYRVEQVIELLLSADNKTFINTLIEFGKLHHNKGAQQKYAKGLAASLQFGLCSVIECNSKTEDAWDTLFRYIMDILKFGMRLEMLNESTIDGELSLITDCE